MTIDKGDEYQRAWGYALLLLDYRERSAEEIARKLREREVAEDEVRKVIGKLERLGLVNDERFARLWVKSRMSSRPRSARLIRYELVRKGLEAETIDRVIGEELPPGREQEAAREAVLRRALRYRRDPPEAKRRKLFAFLARRGFSPEVINDALKNLARNRNFKNINRRSDTIEA